MGNSQAETALRLTGWGRARRTIVLRRQVKADLAIVDESNPKQLRLSFAELADDTVVYEYAVLVTSLPGEILTRRSRNQKEPVDRLSFGAGTIVAGAPP